jgi:hypothetical protein
MAAQFAVIQPHCAPVRLREIRVGEKSAMTTSVVACVLALALVAAAAPALAGEQAAAGTQKVRKSASSPKSIEAGCKTRIEKLDASQAEGEERLAEKNEVIEFCASQYRHDKITQRLVKACAKYEEQPVVKRQFVAECQLAAFNYAIALQALKAEYRK